MSADYPIGTVFKSSGKVRRVCTVIDVYKTYNAEGELVKTRYVATHDFMGQTITEHDLPATSIARGLL